MGSSVLKTEIISFQKRATVARIKDFVASQKYIFGSAFNFVCALKSGNCIFQMEKLFIFKWKKKISGKAFKL